MDKATPAPIMTTDTDKASDKLVEMLRASGAETCNSAGTLFMVSLKDAVAFRDRIIASLCGDVEPVAHMWQHDETGRTGFVEHAPAEELEQWERINKPRRFVAKLYSASTVAALKSRADALAARVAELEKDARRLDAVERNRFELTPLEGGGWDVSQYHSETCDSQLFAVGELTARAAIDSAALAAKGQA